METYAIAISHARLIFRSVAFRFLAAMAEASGFAIAFWRVSCSYERSRHDLMILRVRAVRAWREYLHGKHPWLL